MPYPFWNMANLRLRGWGVMAAFLGAIGLLGAASGVRGTGDAEVEALLGKMRSAYHSVKSVRLTAEGHFGPTVFVSTFTVKAPSRIRLDITSPNSKNYKESLVKVTDGKTISLKLPNDEKYTQQPFTLDNYESNLPSNLESFCFFDADRQLSTGAGKNMEHSTLKLSKNVDWDGKSWTVLEENAPLNGGTVLCRYFIDPKSFFIWRVTVKTGKGEDGGEFILKKLDTKAKIDDSIFAAGPPPQG